MAATPKKPAAKKPAAKKPAVKSPAKIARPKPPKPLDYMLAVLRDEGADPERRDEMAKLAAPYLHAKAKELARDELAAAAGKSRKKPAPAATDTTGSRDADPIIRTARATLQRKLARLAAKSAATPADGGAEP